jgi:hypothetical protein
VVVVFVWLLLQYMRQETKVLRTKQISLDVLTVHDSQCGFLKNALLAFESDCVSRFYYYYDDDIAPKTLSGRIW